MSLDWEGAHARLRAAQERLDEIDQEVGDFEALLHARADAVAAAIARPRPEGSVERVVFTVGAERYAVDATAVVEVIDVGRLTPLPGVPAFYRGVLSHRGIVYPLLDIRPFVGISAGAPAAFAYALLFTSPAATVAIGADAIDGIESDGLAAGVTPLDLGALLADARLIVDG